MIQKKIEDKIRESINTKYLKIVNESHKHHVPKGSESHFRLEVVSEDFRNKSAIRCHQMIYKILEEELKSQIHALSIVAMTPDEYRDSKGLASGSPDCVKKS